MFNKMTLRYQFLSTVSAVVLLVALAMGQSVAPASAEKHEKAAKIPPLTLKQIKASIGKDKKAIIELKGLAEKNHAEAQVYLGDLYMKGVGVYQNFSMAWNWYKRAAEKGHADAQFKLGMMYRNGQGAPVYPEKSTEWLKSAARQGHGDALAFLKKLGLAAPMVMKKPENMAAAKGKKGASMKIAQPSVKLQLEGMSLETKEAPAAVIKLAQQYVKAVNDTNVEALKKLIAVEYAACVNDQNRKVYEDYLLRGVKYRIKPSFTAVIGKVENTGLPFRDTVTYPVPPTSYFRLDITPEKAKPDLTRIEVSAGVIQFMAKKDGKWSLTLGCPSAEGIKRMRHSFGRGKNG